MVQTPCGPFWVIGKKHIACLKYARTPLGGGDAEKEPQSILLTQLVQKQLNEYFFGTRKHFALPLDPETLQNYRLARALQSIPYAQTRSYKQFPPLHPRYVGKLCSQNPLPIILPCHRVVPTQTFSTSGPGQHACFPKKLGGYMLGADAKALLLQLERNAMRKAL